MLQRFAFVCFVCVAFCLPVYAQAPVQGAGGDTTAKPVVAKLRPYDKVITASAVSKYGLFGVHEVDGRWFFEIPDSLMGRDMLAVTRYTATPQGGRVYGGEEVNRQSIFFEKTKHNKILLRVRVYTQDVKDSSQAIAVAVRNSDVMPIVFAFDVKAENKAGNASVIDVTDFFRKESQVVSFPNELKTEKKLNAFADDKSFLDNIKAFPINVEVNTTKTYAAANGVFPAAGTGFVTLQLNTSIVLLPKVPMRKRFFDERVGFFAESFTLFDDEAQSVEKSYFIQRYRLEPKEEDMAKYKKGILVEPKKKITYYIDPATPRKWVPYLIAGVNDWNVAFEQAGFRNAIEAKEWPVGDSTMSLEDARFSVIRYYASDIPNAYGPRITDPRSGEIIESHVGWYHNIMQLLQGWYMVQVAAVDPRARKMVLDDELMGELVRFVSSHEIGHTIGLRHNMGASSATPVEKLRDKAWVEKNGHTVSIMDYARFNYVAQPEDSIGTKGIYPRIGSYDKWAIEWGYRYFPGTNDAFAEKKILQKMIVDTLAAHPELWFGGEGKTIDPRSQTEDLGDDPVKASTYGIMNLKRIVPHLMEWTAEEGDMYNNLQQMYVNVGRQFSRYLYHVNKNLNGVYITQKSTEQPGAVYVQVPADRLRASIAFFGEQVLTPPLWYYDSAILSKLNIDPAKEIYTLQNQFLNILLNQNMMANLLDKSAVTTDVYPLDEYLNDLKKYCWKTLSGNTFGSMLQRTLERSYVERLSQIAIGKKVQELGTSTQADRSDVRLYVRKHLSALQKDVKRMKTKGEINELHRKEMIRLIASVLSFRHS